MLQICSQSRGVRTIYSTNHGYIYRLFFWNLQRVHCKSKNDSSISFYILELGKNLGKFHSTSSVVNNHVNINQSSSDSNINHHCWIFISVNNNLFCSEHVFPIFIYLMINWHIFYFLPFFALLLSKWVQKDLKLD